LCCFSHNALGSKDALDWVFEYGGVISNALTHTYIFLSYLAKNLREDELWKECSYLPIAPRYFFHPTYPQIIPIPCCAA
jgi:hypothetical protein